MVKWKFNSNKKIDLFQLVLHGFPQALIPQVPGLAPAVCPWSSWSSICQIFSRPSWSTIGSFSGCTSCLLTAWSHRFWFFFFREFSQPSNSRQSIRFYSNWQTISTGKGLILNPQGLWICPPPLLRATTLGDFNLGLNSICLRILGPSSLSSGFRSCFGYFWLFFITLRFLASDRSDLKSPSQWFLFDPLTRISKFLVLYLPKPKYSRQEFSTYVDSLCGGPFARCKWDCRLAIELVSAF